MNWVNITKKNIENNIDTNIIKKNNITKDIDTNSLNECYIDYNIRDYEEEFDLKYSANIVNLKIDFKDYIDELCLPFLNMNNFYYNKNKDIYNNHENIYQYTFYDFIKYNSKNYSKLKNKIDKENKEYIKELENQMSDDYFNDTNFHPRDKNIIKYYFTS